MSDSASAASVMRRPTMSIAKHDPYLSMVLNATASVDQVQLDRSIGKIYLCVRTFSVSNPKDQVGYFGIMLCDNRIIKSFTRFNLNVDSATCCIRRPFA